ncbi:dephospho-CoA kinase [Ferrimonas lipolytica]|uniref:Dephospho-CoA kinase n=1 Tax=Ferrimonas lipolytica TaxID=2724191 RepID=A0A6H1UJZ8_9GAMM|nr:dephospho-CoA kinase [Ferrimonas lipolytica]QIZ78546.1 dephospho-CoA kinase [Ferrimonas lipolytica]
MNKLLVGLTGGIGAGKTQVSDRFADLGVTIVDTDVIARHVVAKGSDGLAAITEHFGTKVLTADGQLDRAQLRELVFNQPEQRQWLNRLTHPMIRAEMLVQCQQAASAYVVVVVPLLLEGDMHQLVDRILVVDVDEQTQLKRTIARDNNNPELVKKIIASQIDRPSRLAKADDIIDNSAQLCDLQHQVVKLHQYYLSLTEK